MIRAVIFDCFGVLVGKGFEHTYRLAGGDPVKDRAFIEDMLGQASMGMISDDDFRKEMAARIGIGADAWRKAVLEADLADRELLDYIKELRKTCKTAILSNANRGVVERKIGRNWITECFDEVIVSADVGLVKPDPRIYALATERLGVAPEECVFIDDSPMHIEGARRYGMQVLQYRDFPGMKSGLENLLAAD